MWRSIEYFFPQTITKDYFSSLFSAINIQIFLIDRSREPQILCLYQLFFSFPDIKITSRQCYAIHSFLKPNQNFEKCWSVLGVVSLKEFKNNWSNDHKELPPGHRTWRRSVLCTFNLRPVPRTLAFFKLSVIPFKTGVVWICFQSDEN